MVDRKESRRSMVGAPPTKRAQAAEKPKRGKQIEEEEEVESSSNSEEEDEETANDSQSREPSSPGRRKRKKRRIRLTDYGTKAKKRAERRERERTEKKETSEMADESPRKEREQQPSEDEVETKPTFEEYSPLQLLCDCLLRKFMLKDPEEFFSQPVLADVAPDYHQVIETPMDFSTMRKKVDSNEYRSIEDLKKDINLIADNAMSYNKPNTVYYLAAQKLTTLIKFYFSEPHLEYLRYSLPFGNEIPHELMSLKPKAPIRSVVSTMKRDSKSDSIRAAIFDKVDAKTVLKQNSTANGCKLSELKPNLAYIDGKKDGPISLNILTGDEKCSVTLGDLVGRLEKGTSKLPTSYELLEDFDSPVSYTNYGPFGSFAPQFDSTWATLSKRDSDTLIGCFGSKRNVADAMALRQVAADSGAALLKAVDGILDTLTDGEHSRMMRKLEEEQGQKEEENEADKMKSQEVFEPVLCKLLDDVSSLENLGLDMSYLKDIRKQFGLEEKEPTVEDKLDANGRMISDLNILQQNRLNTEPALNLSDIPQPSQAEANLACKVVQQLTTVVSQNGIPPNGIASTQAIHKAIGIDDDECDLDLLSEFMVMNE